MNSSDVDPLHQIHGFFGSSWLRFINDPCLILRRPREDEERWPVWGDFWQTVAPKQSGIRVAIAKIRIVVN